jgi:hypothetical protein
MPLAESVAYNIGYIGFFVVLAGAIIAAIVLAVRKSG